MEPNKRKASVKVCWLSDRNFPVGHVFTNIFGKEVGSVVSNEVLGERCFRTEAHLNEDLPLEVMLRVKKSHGKVPVTRS